MSSGMHIFQFDYSPVLSSACVDDALPTSHTLNTSPSSFHLGSIEYLDNDDDAVISSSHLDTSRNGAQPTLLNAAYDLVHGSIWSPTAQSEETWASFSMPGRLEPQQTAKPFVFTQPQPRQYAFYNALPHLERIASELSSTSPPSSSSASVVDALDEDESITTAAKSRIPSFREWLRRCPDTGNCGPGTDSNSKQMPTTGKLKFIRCFFRPSEIQSCHTGSWDPSIKPASPSEPFEHPSFFQAATFQGSGIKDEREEVADWDEQSLYSESECSDVDVRGIDADNDTHSLTPPLSPPRPSHDVTIRRLAQMLRRNE